MTQDPTCSILTVRDPRTGKFAIVRGAGALKDSTFRIKEGVDLTKPIAAQVLKPARKHKAAKG